MSYKEDKDRIEFEENDENTCSSVAFFKSKDKAILNMEAEDTDYYSHGVVVYRFSAEQIQELKNFLINEL